jgi:translation initiation factor 5B
LQRDQIGGDTEPNKDLIGGVSSQDEDHPSGSQTRTSGFSAFAAAGLTDEIPDDDDADGGGGGLMVSMFCSSRVFLRNQSLFPKQSLIKSSAKSKKARKQKGKADSSDVLEEQDRVDAGSKTPVEATADDLADETWNNKGKKGKADVVGEESEVKGMYSLIRVLLYFPLTPFEDETAVVLPDPKPQEEDNLEEGEEPGVKILSKKEKEKLKKEREKVSSIFL